MKAKRKKEWLHGIIALIGCMIILTGCCMSHEWKKATCTESKTCTKCGETEGEPLGHTWVEATCAEPKHCNVCGQTEGNALEHTLTKANYQQPATCSVCGETVGEPLQAYFEKYNILCDTKLDTGYTFTVFCRDSKEDASEMYVVFSDYEVFESDENHEALDGYEWRAVTCTMTASDENAQKFGVTAQVSGADYYDDDSFYDNHDEEKDTHTINYNGVDYTEIQIDWDRLQNGWDIQTRIFTFQTRLYACVPKGYDGIVMAIYSVETDDMEPQTNKNHKCALIFDDSLYARTGGKGTELCGPDAPADRRTVQGRHRAAAREKGTDTVCPYG